MSQTRSLRVAEQFSSPRRTSGETLANLQRELARTGACHEGFSAAVKAVVQLTGAAGCSLLDLAPGRLRVVVAAGRPKQLSASQLESMRATAVYVCESSFDPARSPAVVWPASDSAMVAVADADRPFGVLWVTASPAVAFDAEDARLVECVALLLTGALERAHYRALARHAASHDAQTDLLNRAGLAAFMSSERAGKDSTVALLAFGVCESGDTSVSEHETLALARRLRELTSVAQTVARVSSEEFLVLCPDIDSAVGAFGEAQRILSALAVPFLSDGARVAPAASVGMALASSEHGHGQEFISQASTALRCAKRSGRGMVAMFDAEQRSRERTRRALERELWGSLDREEMSVAYQPLVDLRSYRVCGFEALLRWQHPRMGDIAPGQFVAVAEQSGFIVDLGAFVLRRALAQVARWRERVDSQVKVNVNVSACQLDGYDLPADVLQALAVAGVPASALGLELTESAVLSAGTRPASEMLGELRSEGVSLLLDDFGTGYSSLAYLKNFPFDVLKLDRAFVAEVPGSATDEAIAQASLTMARALGIDVVAEGVETAAQRDWFMAHGARYAQGYLLGRPLTAERAGALLATGQP